MTADLAGPIAITGMAARLPGAPDVAGFWSALRAGAEGITHHDKAALLAAGGDPALIRQPEYVPSRGMLPSARNFDWSFFGYSRTEAALIDPQQRVFLECAADALDDAGIDPTRFPGWIGAYGGSDDADPAAYPDAEPVLRAMGHSRDFTITRVAYKLGLRGPAFTVQTACSTSLTAVHLAVQSLRAHECDAALAGGVGLAGLGATGYLYVEDGACSRDGRCRPFDEQASGMVPGEGAGVVVLRRLADALADGDRVYAIIRGSAINNDGGEKIGFTAPSVPGQRDVVLRAQQAAGVSPWDIDYVEAHGTATPIGDPVEVQALTDAFRRSHDGTGWCRLGAVKSNIGHTGAAAGVAGLIKTALMLTHRELVPSLHFTKPNRLLDLEQTPFTISTRREPWPERGVPTAAVSAFGVGGTNAHVVMQAPPCPGQRPARTAPRVLALSAATPAALDRLRHAAAGRLAQDDQIWLGDASLTLARRRRLEHRLAVVAREPREAAELLTADYDQAKPASLGRVAFLFPGHGTLDHPAGAAAYRLLPAFRGHFDEMATAFRREHGLDLSPVVTGGQDDSWFTDPVHQQCGLVTLGYALGKQLMDWGVRPAGLLGNSVGEYTAAVVAGLWTPADCAGVLFESLQTTRRPEPGRMIAVRAGADAVAARIAPFDGVGVAIAGPGTTVISGLEAAIDACVAAGALDGLKSAVLESPVAGHSEAMRTAAGDLARAIGRRPIRPPALPIVANLTGTWADPDAVATPGYWTEQLCRTVQLDPGVKTLIDAGCDTFVELGAGTSMCGTLRRHAAWDPARTVVPMLGRAAEDNERALLRAIGTLWELGAGIDLAELTRGEAARVVSLPPYPFEAGDPRLASGPATPASSGRGGRGGRGRRPGREARQDAPFSLEQLWCTTLGVASVRATDDFFALGGESLMAIALVSHIRERTGVQITAAEFLRQPTFGAISELAGQSSPRGQAGPRGGTGAGSGLVLLRQGAGRPVFLAADAMGTAASYLLLAGLVDCDRPVYGLEPPSARTAARIEELAQHHLDAVRGVQPQGPYTLGGWSFGAVVAHEMARRLTAAGEPVDVLVCIDGAIRDRGGRPLGADPAALLETARLVSGALTGVGPVGALLRRAPELRRNFTASAGALLRYRPRPVPCPMVLFKAGAPSPAACAALQRALSGLYSSVRIVPADGDHWSMLTSPSADGLARELTALLAAPERHTTPV